VLRLHRLRDKQWQTEEGIDAVVAATKDRNGGPIWVEAIAPDAAECAALVRQFALRERLLEDAVEPLTPPVLREFDEHLFLIVHAPETSNRKETRKIALFLGDRWLVTVVRAPLPLLEPLVAQLKRHPDYYLSRADFIAEAILDHMAQVFEERVDEMIDQVEAISDRVLEDPDRGALPELHQLRRRAAAFTRIVRAQRDVCQ
jgi:magnesium transporter